MDEDEAASKAAAEAFWVSRGLLPRRLKQLAFTSQVIIWFQTRPAFSHLSFHICLKRASDLVQQIWQPAGESHSCRSFTRLQLFIKL